jgi:hypothetical protein
LVASDEGTLQFLGIIWVEIRPACAAKDPKGSIVGIKREEAPKICFLIDHTTRKTIYKVNRSDKSFIPKLKRHRSMGKKREANLNNVVMFSLCRPILLMGMRARHVRSNANALEEGVQALILPTPICLHSHYFLIKETFNMVLEIMKTLKNFRFVSKKINPCKLTEIINKAHIVIVSSNISWSGTPYIREDKVQRIIRHTN